MSTATATALAQAATIGASVTVKKTGGREFVGVPVSAGEPLTYKIATGKRGRPAIVHADDVEEVAPVS